MTGRARRRVPTPADAISEEITVRWRRDGNYQEDIGIVRAPGTLVSLPCDPPHFLSLKGATLFSDLRRNSKHPFIAATCNSLGKH
jgi:hypothetical protein